MPTIVLNAKIQRVPRKIDAASGFLPVNLISEEIELPRLQFHDERAFRRIRTVTRLATPGDTMRFAPGLQVRRSAAIDGSVVIWMSRVVAVPKVTEAHPHGIAR